MTQTPTGVLFRPRLTQEAFLLKYLDEVVGLLLAGFAAEANSRGIANVHLAARGRHLVETLTLAKKLLCRIHADFPAPAP